MVPDPYAPPKAEVADPTDGRPRRPKSVLVLIVVGYGFLVSALAAVLRHGLALFDPSLAPSRPFLLFRFGLFATLMLLLAVMLLMVHRTSKIGHAFGVVFILIAAVPGVMALFVPIPQENIGDQLYIFFYYSTMLLYNALIAYWAYAFALSRKSRTYFGYKSN